MLLKNGRDPGGVRPDIAHQNQMLMSPKLSQLATGLYIHTQKNVLIEVNSRSQISIISDRFCCFMVQLLHKLSVPAADGPQNLFNLSVEYTEKMVFISNYLLSAALTCAKLTTTFEEGWSIIDSRTLL
ncbi:LOW QUALITY PROTEIN: ribosomal RNA small subunit methyltransferase NEP1-like [Molossus nigricans]